MWIGATAALKAQAPAAPPRVWQRNPLSTEAVSSKVRDLILPVIGAANADQLIVAVNRLQTAPDMRALRPLLIA